MSNRSLNFPLIQTALRVLQAYAEYRHPSPDDLAILRQAMLRQQVGDRIIAPDALACEVIQRELAGRKTRATAA